MTHFSTPALKEAFTDHVLELLAVWGKAHRPTGNRDGEMSLSHLVDCLRHSKGWSNLRTTGWEGNVTDLLKECGFTVRTQLNGRSVRTYVGV